MRLTVDEDHVQLMQLMAAAPNVPKDLDFWIRHMRPEAAEIWKECPRMDWLFTIAEACGVTDGRIEVVRRAVQSELDKRAGRASKRDPETRALPHTPAIEGANLVRCYMPWRECLNGRHFAAAARAAMEKALATRAVA